MRGRLQRGLGVLGALLALAALFASAAAIAPRGGQPLSEGERRQLLLQAGLPANFPVHPEAQRMRQPTQGGFSYAVSEPVPDAAEWMEEALTRAGYDVFDTDVPGQDPYLPHWLYFRGPAGLSGAVLVRDNSRGLLRQSTEVKVLSARDARLAPPAATVPSSPLPR
jgi:hypothetical protein